MLPRTRVGNTLVEVEVAEDGLKVWLACNELPKLEGEKLVSRMAADEARRFDWKPTGQCSATCKEANTHADGYCAQPCYKEARHSGKHVFECGSVRA